MLRCLPFLLLPALLFSVSACLAKGAPVIVFDRSALTWDERCTAESLQGLVNRAGPRLFLSDGGQWDRRWLEVYAERCGLTYQTLPDLASLLRHFAPELKGLVVWDPALDASRYVAITMSGVTGLLPVSPGLLAGDTPALRGNRQWPGSDFTRTADSSFSEWRRAGVQPLAAVPEGMLMQCEPTGSGWGFASYGPITVDLDHYPFLEVETARLQGEDARWLVKLTWDRNRDGTVGGAPDDLNLTIQATAGRQRWNLAQLGGVSGKHTFALLQLHVAGKGSAGAVFRSARFVSAAGEAPAPAPGVKPVDLGLRVVEDLRGRFATNVAAYDWALGHLMPSCSRQLAHAVNGGTVDGILTGICGPMSGFDWQVQSRGFVFNLGCTPERQLSYGARTGGSPEQAATYRRILGALKTPAMVTGYGDPEGTWCSLLSEYGHYSFHAFHNWSFHSKVPPSGRPLRQKLRYTPGNTRPEAGKYYVCFMTSEGDTMKGPLPFFYGSWFDPARGQVPVNWGINPLMARHFSAMLEYYYATATPQDYFFAGCSGAGYCYPDQMKDLEGFCRQTRDLCAAADLPCIDLWGASSWETLRRYEAVTRPLSLTSFTGPARLGFVGGGTPVAFHELGYWQTYGLDSNDWGAAFADDAKRAAAVRRLVGRIEAIAARTTPPFVILVYGDLHSYSRHASLYREVAAALDPARFKPARLDEAMSAVRAWAQDRVMLGAHGINEPLHWAALQAVPTAVPVTLTSGFSRPVAVSLTATVDGATAEAEATLQPWERQELDGLSLCPAEAGLQRVRLRVRAAGKTESYRADAIGVPAPGVTARQARLEALWGAGQVSHESGRMVDEAEAMDGRAWAPPADGKPCCLVYGPYATVPKGRYAICFRLKLPAGGAEAASDTPVAKIDVFAGGYQASHQVHAERELRRGDFRTPGQWEWFVLQADWAGAPDCLESRVYWHGKAELLFDRVAAFELKD